MCGLRRPEKGKGRTRVQSDAARPQLDRTTFRIAHFAALQQVGAIETISTACKERNDKRRRGVDAENDDVVSNDGGRDDLMMAGRVMRELEMAASLGFVARRPPARRLRQTLPPTTPLPFDVRV